MNATPADSHKAHRQGKAGYKTALGRDRLQEAPPPMMEGHCDCCGVKFSDDTPTHTRRGDLRKYCSAECRKTMRKREAAVATFLYNRMAVARMFKHADPERANVARAEMADFFADHFERLDTEREQMTADDGLERVLTADIRAAARRARA
jgi:hypothetical protein